ncbi:helix-turn-helix transcriptional regulator [Pseudomonas paraeruginosa]|uniref:helix-turn-helix transcriptional regulator n=1 Tax=Pseudomonas paraeruginosa TaxID=2994495 RepID=UPI00053D3AB7|nr:AlpA family transcriptional regulator [Pseudomonas paraeruginosa]
MTTNNSPAAPVSARLHDPATTLIRMPEVEAITGLARPTIYKRMKDDPTFPKPVPLSNSAARGAPVAWVLGEVQAWVRGRIAARGEVAA